MLVRLGHAPRIQSSLRTAQLSKGSAHHFAGEVHGGLNRFNRRQLATILAKVPQRNCPFANLPDRRPDRWGEGIMATDMANYIWLKPTTSVRIAFVEWTLGERLRHPRFVALTE